MSIPPSGDARLQRLKPGAILPLDPGEEIVFIDAPAPNPLFARFTEDPRIVAVRGLGLSPKDLETPPRRGGIDRPPLPSEEKQAP